MTATELTWCLAAIAIAACGSDPSPAHDPPEADTDAVGSTAAESSSSEGEEPNDDGYLTPVEHLLRISMALRGIRPSPEDLRRVEDDPDAVAELVDAYMTGPQFAETIRELHNDALLVRVPIPLPAVGPFAGMHREALSRSVEEMSLRLAEHVVLEDRPYSEIVTADYWVVDDVAAAVFGTGYDADGPRWQAVPIPGPRPAAGILSDNAFFLRHPSAGANYNRGRANAVSRALLCQDFLALEVAVDGSVDLADPDAVADAVRENPACAACHEQLDPLASHFFAYPGEIVTEQLDALEYPAPDLWQPQLEDDWSFTNERAPAYFGEPSGGLAELGRFIADDPRFAACAARRFYAYFHQQRVEDVDDADVDAIEAAFVAADLDARTLIREIVLGDAFRRADVRGYLKARPFQLALLFEDLTGFAWELQAELERPEAGVGTLSVTRDPRNGLALLAGGIDSEFVVEPSLTVNATTSLFLRELAREAASFVVERDLGAASPKLLTSGESDEDVVRAQLHELVLRVYAETEPDEADIDLLWAVFAGALADGADVQHAWKATLTAMFQDVSIIYY